MADDNNNMANVPMRQLAGCIPEIADGAGRDLFSLLTPAPPLLHTRYSRAKKAEKYCQKRCA